MTAADCLFCKIASKTLPAKVVYEDDLLIAIEDINPAAPVHILIIPKEHISSLNELQVNHVALLGQIQLLAARLASQLNIAEPGYRLVNNCGEMGGQTVMHLHYHLLGGRNFGWPPG
ncbi:histidine triad nucleotide-binding protein [Syntrophomonas palmitatica]|uniref:histidine triad nucleotide-binding protein n=1 Tax=Syntrophomonas palmitatica TaxID=402877 RepID=UPI0006D097EA|nr:histidine triad nucleotide-binding protein [Syntrophomonas palmitatica]